MIFYGVISIVVVYVDKKNVSVYGFHYTMLLVMFIISVFFFIVPLPNNECLSIYNFPSIIKQTYKTLTEKKGMK